MSLNLSKHFYPSPQHASKFKVPLDHFPTSTAGNSGPTPPQAVGDKQPPSSLLSVEELIERNTLAEKLQSGQPSLLGPLTDPTAHTTLKLAPSNYQPATDKAQVIGSNVKFDPTDSSKPPCSSDPPGPLPKAGHFSSSDPPGPFSTAQPLSYAQIAQQPPTRLLNHFRLQNHILSMSRRSMKFKNILKPISMRYESFGLNFFARL